MTTKEEKRRPPSDMGEITGGVITYIALPPLTGTYKETLIKIGKDCCHARGVYEKSKSQADHDIYKSEQAALDSYERMLRKQFGVPVTRKEFKPRIIPVTT